MSRELHRFTYKIVDKFFLLGFEAEINSQLTSAT